MSSRKAKIVKPNEGHWISWLGHPVRYLAFEDDTNSKYSFSWGTVPVGGGPPPHSHTFEEGFYVLKGEVKFTAGNQSVALSAGGFIQIGSGTSHTLKNIGEQEAELLVITAPAGFDQFQLEGGQAMDGKEGAVTPFEPGMITKLAEIAPKYGINLKPTDESFEQMPNIKVCKPEEGNFVAAAGDLYRFLAETDSTNGQYAIWEATVFPNGGPPPHVHSQEEEGFYLFEGELTFYVDGEKIVATAGTFVNLPTGVPHAFKNETNNPAKMLIIVASAGLEAMFVRTGQVVENASAIPNAVTPEEIALIKKIAPEYGVDILIPESH